MVGLRRSAEEETGLSDWGSEAFAEPLQLYLDSIEESAGFHAQGQHILRRSLLRLLGNRLRMQRDFAKHPEIGEAQIPRPLYVLGLPRTGTTLLHNLLACDPAARSIRLWEGIFPSPPQPGVPRESDPRIAMAMEWAAAINQLAPDLARAHELNPTGPEECLWLIEHTFVDFIHELRAHVPAYSAWLEEHEAGQPVYEEYRRMLQLLAWQHQGQHWVFKAPRHLMGLPGLLKVFPEARIVQTHRDPGEVMPSLCSLCEIDRKIFAADPDRKAIGDLWMRRLGGGMKTAMGAREADLEKERYVDVHYKELVADPIGAVRGIYEKHGYPYSDAFEEAMRAWLEANRQHKHGVHRYALEDYGLSSDRVNEVFADYRKRFQL